MAPRNCDLIWRARAAIRQLACKANANRTGTCFNCTGEQNVQGYLRGSKNTWKNLVYPLRSGKNRFGNNCFAVWAWLKGTMIQFSQYIWGQSTNTRLAQVMSAVSAIIYHIWRQVWMSYFSNCLTPLRCFISCGWSRTVDHCIAWHFGNSMQGSWWHPWHCSTSRTEASIDHASPWKDMETNIYFRGFWAYMSVIHTYIYIIYIHGIHFSSLYHMTMPILDLRWRKRISRTFFWGPRKRAEKIALSYPSE